MNHRTPRQFLRLLIILLWASSRVADSAEGEIVTARTASAGPVSGSLVELGDETLLINAAGGQQVRLPRETLISIERDRSSDEKGQTPDALVLLTNGDLLVGKATTLAEETLTVEWTGGSETLSLPIPLELVTSIVLSQPSEASERERLRRHWGLLKPPEDQVLLHTGTSVAGELTDLDRDRIVIETALGLVETPRDQAAAILLNAQLASTPERPQEFSIVSFGDGSRLSMEQLRLDGQGNLYGKALVGVLLKFPMRRVRRVQFFNQRIVSLTDLEQAQYTFTPFLEGAYPLVRHRNVQGGPLKLRGTTYATGLGMHSQGAVTYDLAEHDFANFTATIGIDDLAEGRGQALFAVEVDNQRVYESGNVDGRADPITLDPIDISGAQKLTLIVEFGRRGDILDIANWCDPLLLK